MKTSKKQSKQNLVEIARSFSRKVNTGNYTTLDFFCSAKEEVLKGEEIETSKRLFNFCKVQVENSIQEYLKGDKPDGNEIWDEHRQKLYDMDAETKEEEMNTEAERLCQHND